MKKNPLRALLLVPPFVEEGLEMGAKESIGVCYLAAVLRQNGAAADILDADLLGLSVAETVDGIRGRGYDLIGLSVLEGTVESTEAIVAGLRNAKETAHITLGGYLPTLIPEAALAGIPGADSVAVGEGEAIFAQLAGRLAEGGSLAGVPGLVIRDRGELIRTPPAPGIDLDGLPFPERDLLPEVFRRGGVVGVVGSRGCYGNCSFCCINRFGKACGSALWRGRSVENIVEEIQYLNRTYGLHTISFYDSNFIGPGKAGYQRTHEFADEIQRRGLSVHFALSTRPDQVDRDLFAALKKAGLTEVFIGLESMSQRSLDFYNKQSTVADNIRAAETLESLGILFRPGFILYEPFMDLSGIRENIDFLKRLLRFRHLNKFHFFKALRIYRGSPLEDELDRRGVLIRKGWHNSYRFQSDRVARFTEATRPVGSKMLPVLAQSADFDTETRRHIDRLLGRWSIDIYDRMLRRLEQFPDTPSAALAREVSGAAEKGLQKIERIVDRYAGSLTRSERRNETCIAV